MSHLLLRLHLKRTRTAHEANAFAAAAHRVPKHAIAAARGAVIRWRIVAGAVCGIARGKPALIAATPRIEEAHLILVVAEVERAEVTIVTNDAAVARILRADAVDTHAGISIPVTALTAVAPHVLTLIIKGEIPSTFVVVVTSVLLADQPGAYAQAVLYDLLNTVEVAFHDVAVPILTLSEIRMARIASAVILVVAFLVRLAPFGSFSFFPAPHDPQHPKCQHGKSKKRPSTA
jgi:hypothetical protein